MALLFPLPRVQFSVERFPLHGGIIHISKGMQICYIPPYISAVDTYLGAIARACLSTRHVFPTEDMVYSMIDCKGDRDSSCY